MFLQAGSPAELRAYMAQYPDSRCIAGGTDIMPDAVPQSRKYYIN